jgi:hypothetical protein
MLIKLPSMQACQVDFALRKQLQTSYVVATRMQIVATLDVHQPL